MGSVLEFVQQEMGVAHAQFLVDKGGVGAADDLAQDRIGFVQAHHVFLLEQLREGAVEFPGEAQAEDERIQDQGGVVEAVRFFEELRHARRIFDQRLFVYRADAHPFLHGEAQGLGLLCKILDHGAAAIPYRLQALLGEGLDVVDSVAFRERAVLVAPEQAADFEQAIVDMVATALLQGIGEAGTYPVEQFHPVLGQRIQDAVH